MSSSQLPNYLRSCRKRLAFTQDDVAFLLGAQSEATISRLESFDREPSLKQALALGVIYNTPIHELFAGVYQEVEREIAVGAKNLAQVKRSIPEQHAAIRKEALNALIASATPTQI